MIMRVNKIVTHFGPGDAYAIIEFIDQLRDMLLQAYGDDIRVMLQEASAQKPSGEVDEDVTF